MEMPQVVNEMKYPKRNFTFRVRAYRTLDRGEMRMSYVLWNRQRDKRRSLRNKTVEVTSLIGRDEAV